MLPKKLLHSKRRWPATPLEGRYWSRIRSNLSRPWWIWIPSTPWNRCMESSKAPSKILKSSRASWSRARRPEFGRDKFRNSWKEWRRMTPMKKRWTMCSNSFWGKSRKKSRKRLKAKRIRIRICSQRRKKILSIRCWPILGWPDSNIKLYTGHS